MLLSIESSCDDSSIAITEITSRTLLWHRKISQDSAHTHYGGVVPEIASRLHTQSLPHLLAQAKEFLGSFDSIKGIALTTEPGLSVSLIEGLMMAKILALSLRVPLVSVNHLIGHFYSLFINKPRAIFPMSVLLVSGGHTQILQARDERHFHIIAQSLDDSFGESFDKVAKMLGLGYPGGPIIEKHANAFNTHPTRPLYPLPLPLKDKIGFSFSGLKNATRLLIEECVSKSTCAIDKNASKDIDNNVGGEVDSSVESKMDFHTESSSVAKSGDTAKHSSAAKSNNADNGLDSNTIEYVCASFQTAAIKHIAHQVEKYLKTHRASSTPIRDFAIVGGASSNRALRQCIEYLCISYGVRLHLAEMEFCADNAAMIGRAGIVELETGRFVNVISQDISPRNTTECIINS